VSCDEEKFYIAEGGKIFMLRSVSKQYLSVFLGKFQVSNGIYQIISSYLPYKKITIEN